jgi:hypothetical protein
MQSNTTGADNVALGVNALANNSTASSNTAVGICSLLANTTGYDNVGIGRRAVDANTTGIGNIGIGSSALTANTTANSNVAIGTCAMFVNTTGCSNVAIGGLALCSNTNAYNNTVVGYCAGDTITTGQDNTIIGYNGTPNLSTGFGNVTIGDIGSVGSRLFNITTENYRFLAGHPNITNAYVKVAWTVTSDARDKMNISTVPHGLDFVNQLNPVSFNFKKDRDTEIPNGNKRYGFLAQDIMALEGDNPVIIDNEQPEHLKYQGEALVPVLVNAIKELKSQNEDLKSRIEVLENS